MIPAALASYWWILALVLFVLFIACYRVTFRIFGVVVVDQDSLGIVNKKFVLIGKNKTLPDGRIIALKGEAGIQADTLAPGLHWGYWPWQYVISMETFTTIPQGGIGVVESRDGVPLPAGRVLARKVADCDCFQNARAFLETGGERGPQITIIPPGTYRINTKLFSVANEKITQIKDGKVGIVTTKEGAPLPRGDIAGKEVAGHNSFQDAQVFINAGGFKGLQEQVILAGNYFINPRFATIEEQEMTTVPIAHVGVVIAYVGEPGVDVTGAEFKHGNLVSSGQKGVWKKPYDPGRYPINPYTHKVECVPTANIVLNWANSKSEAHNLDKNLCTITVRSSDGFTFNLDVSQIIHIPSEDAPMVIARFGSVANLVTQVLEPTIGNYFRNSAQGSNVIDFLKFRQQRQEEAKTAITNALTLYNVKAVDTLIGDIVPPAELMKILTDKKLAEQEKATYETQMEAENSRKELEQSRAMAATQSQVVAAERKVQIAEFDAQSSVKKAEGEAKSQIIAAEANAKSKVVNAEAEATMLETVGKATGAKILAIGTAESEVIQFKIKSIGDDNYARIQIADSVSKSTFRLVPDVLVNGNGETDGSSSLLTVLMGNLVGDDLKKKREAITAKSETSAKANESEAAA